MRKNVLYLIVVGTLPLYAMEKMETFLQDTKGKEWNPELQQQFDSAYQDINLKITLKKCKPNSSWKYKEEFKNRLFERCNYDNKIGSKEYQKYQRFMQYAGWKNECAPCLRYDENQVKKIQEAKSVEDLLQEFSPEVQKLWSIIQKTKAERRQLFDGAVPATKEGIVAYLEGPTNKLLQIIYAAREQLDFPSQEVLEQESGITIDNQRSYLCHWLQRRQQRIYLHDQQSLDGNYTEYPYGRLCPPYIPTLAKTFLFAYPPCTTTTRLAAQHFVFRLTEEDVKTLYGQLKKEQKTYQDTLQKWTAEKRELLRDTLKEWKKIEAKDKERLQLEELSDTVMDIVIIGGKSLIDAFGQAQKRNPVLSIDSFIDQLSQKEVRDLYAEYERDKEIFRRNLGPITDDDF